MTPQETARYRTKAGTLAAAWQQTLGEAPTRRALTLALAVADLETGMGSVKGRNWGSVHKRTLTPQEAAILLGHGVFATDKDALATARGLLAPTQGQREELFIDSGPAGQYFVWLWAFPNDAEAAGKFLEILVRDRPSVRAIVDTASPTALAAAMYATRYFEGTSRDPRENIRAYAAHIESHASRVESALLGWPAAAPALPGDALPSAPIAKRGGVGWWLAGLAAIGIGAFYMGRRA